VVVIGTSYLSLFSHGTVAEDPRVYFLIGAILVSILVLQRDLAYFQKPVDDQELLIAIQKALGEAS
jgi:hypothetical protein